MTVSRVQRRRLVCTLIVCALGVAGCGAKKTPRAETAASVASVAPTTAEPANVQLSVGDATVLSRLLFSNYDAGGAKFRADVPYGLRSSIVIDGVVDWKDHLGKAEVKVVGTDGAVVDTSTVFWRNLYDPQAAVVVTTLKGLTEAMAAEGQDGVQFVARAASDQSPLDHVLRYLDGMATAQAENPLLLRQDEKARSLGTQTITGFDGSDLDAIGLRYGKSRYWADPATKLLVMASAPLAGLPTETEFRFAEHAAQTVVLPPAAEVVDVATIPQIYERLTTKR